jgi:hypothetical protein
VALVLGTVAGDVLLARRRDDRLAVRRHPGRLPAVHLPTFRPR